jgi:hypothetical protein
MESSAIQNRTTTYGTFVLSVVHFNYSIPIKGRLIRLGQWVHPTMGAKCLNRRDAEDAEKN